MTDRGLRGKFARTSWFRAQALPAERTVGERSTLARLSVGILFAALTSAAPALEPENGETGLRSASLVVGPTTYQGVALENSVVSFRGIPFARPPVAERRWKRPEAVPQPDGTFDATRFAPACMQSGSGAAWYQKLMTRIGADPMQFPVPEYSEDCLYLNVWTQADRAQPGPVIVYIHGGSNTGGWSYEPNYHGDALAARGAVVVTLAYRLGVFGFLTHPDVTARNLALHDLAMGLSWVKNNIAGFGGDPRRITLMGESAGAANASHLLISPLARGLATQLIHQSGGWQFNGLTDTAEAERRGLAFEQRLLGGRGRFSAMQGASAAEVMRAATETYEDFYFTPVSDPDSLPNSLGELAADGNLPAFNLLIGSNADEALMYIQPGSTLESWLAEADLNPEAASKALARVSAMTELQELNELRSAVQFACPSFQFANAQAASGGRVFVYEFARVRKGLDSIGAYHGAELPYVFDTHDAWLATSQRDRRLTAQLVDYWLSFASTGRPKSDIAPDWPLWNVDRLILHFGDMRTTVTAQEHDFCKALGLPIAGK